MQKIKIKREPKYDAKFDARSFQTEAVSSIKNLEYAAVFHEQGLGKTKIAIDLILYWLEMKMLDTVLVIVKKSLLNTWRREFCKHSHIIPKELSQDRHRNYYVFNSPSRVILTNYEVIKSELRRMYLFLKARNVGVILDESAKIKNPRSNVTKAFFEIAPLFKKRIIMTGTPADNRPYDIWAQIWFLDKGKSLGDNFKEFQNEVDLTNKLYKDQKAQQELSENLASIYPKISTFTVRETKNSGIIELPEKVIKTIGTDWESKQFALYKQVRDEERAIIMKEGILTEDKSDEVLKRLLRLVQIASNPHVIDSNYRCLPGKYEYLIAIIQKIIHQKEKCIVWSSFIKNVDWLTEKLKIHGACKIYGKMSMKRRDLAIDRFIDEPECKILVATPGAAKEGLTLTVANHVIFYDRGFGLSDYTQAQARIHRISQEKRCYVYNLIMNDSIDEWVDVLLESKSLAAQLAQGDISQAYYESKMSYDFGKVIKNILNLEGGCYG